MKGLSKHNSFLMQLILGFVFKVMDAVIMNIVNVIFLLNSKHINKLTAVTSIKLKIFD